MSGLSRLVFPALRWRARTGFSHEGRRIDETLRLGVGGYLLFGGPAEAVRALTRELNQAAPHPLLLAADCERGAAQQFPDLTHLPPPAALGFIGQPELTARCGAITAREALSVGVNWVYAPVADLDLEPENPIVQTRSFGDDPEAVARQVTAWITAAEGAGVVTSVKHYPGHGRTAVDSHATLPVVPEPPETLRADLLPFARAVAAGARSVMSAHVAYSAWDPSGVPASLSPTILGHLRSDLGFDGVVVSDALIMEGAVRGRGEQQAVVQAVAAGVDALLYPRDAPSAIRALEAGVGGALARARADQAISSISRLAETVGSPGSGVVPPPDAGAEHATFADAVADLALHTLRGEQLRLREPLEILVVDDDVGGPYAVGRRDLFALALRSAGIRLVAAPRAGPEAPAGAARVVLIYAEPRSWKGRASLGPRSTDALRRHLPQASLVVLFGHPRLLHQIGGEAPVLCAFHGQPLMQQAAARWVVGRMT
ncbi:MAG TPA: glycoside hydrolase family 3 N-terminal domain-containing protein [Gemmatimonadales bacterium]|nr:glycoside hydrolase family 3 N-terminal domain-containing protein [Gemmatimonadales bacterium]